MNLLSFFKRKPVKPYSDGTLCFGSGEAWEAMPILNLPSDTIKVRRRIRNTDLMRVYVKTLFAVRCYEVERVGDSLKLLYPTAQNSKG